MYMRLFGKFLRFSRASVIYSPSRCFAYKIMEAPERVKLSQVIGLNPAKVDETLKNADLTTKLCQVADLATQHSSFVASQALGNYLYKIATTTPAPIASFIPALVDYVVSGKINSVPKLEAAIEHLKKKKKLETAEFEEACGVGVEVTDQQIRDTVDSIVERDREAIQAEGWQNKGLIGIVIGKVRAVHKWGNPATIKQAVDEKLEQVLGSKSESPQQPGAKIKKKKSESTPTLVEETKRDKLSTCIGREIISAENTEEQLRKHLEFTGGKVFTRFPPEPNGYLHIGHARAIRFSFKMAEEYDGYCYLRFDDTNPDKENEEFIENIKRNLGWLGYTPWKVTHASEYFQEMYDLACEMIRKGKAYVDEQPAHLIKEQRKAMQDSPYRDTSVEENLTKFENMRKGMYEEGKACLRMKFDMKHDNPCMRDPVAYRIKYKPHPHVGDKWCVYPTYDFEHCIVDSLENITHSLCTLEFEIRRESYYELLKVLDLYKPKVWEYSRLNLTYTVMSKRRLQQLVEEKWVKGWDDPRMPTLNGLKRRGYTSESINNFIDLVGVARRGNENVISIKLLEHCVRQDLDNRAPRTMAVLEPLRVVITNLTENSTLEVPDFPKNPEKGSHKITVSPVIFIDKSDFQLSDSSSFFGLAPGKIVGLKYCPFKIKCIDVVKDGENVSEVRCEAIYEDMKVKGVLHWISAEDSTPAEVRLYDTLFKSENPNDTGNWLNDFNHDSLTVLSGVLISKSLAETVKVEDKFQFERVGYFSLDPDSTDHLKVFNRVVTLQEGKKKQLAKK